MTSTRTTTIPVSGPYDLGEVARMGFGHRDEPEFDGVLRLAFCAEPDLAVPVGVEVRQQGSTLGLAVQAPGAGLLDDERTAAVTAQVARIVSADHDGVPYAELCARDPVLARLHAAAPGFRPALFHSAYEALVWAVLSARRSRVQAIPLRLRLGEQLGTTFDLAGRPTVAVPTPTRLRELTALPGLPADRVPRLHAIAEAAAEGRLATDRLRALPPEEAAAELRQLPGIGPFSATLVVVRALGHADVPATEESHGQQAVARLYGLDAGVDADALAGLAEGWRPFRTWVQVAARAVGDRLPG